MFEKDETTGAILGLMLLKDEESEREDTRNRNFSINEDSWDAAVNGDFLGLWDCFEDEEDEDEGDEKTTSGGYSDYEDIFRAILEDLK